MPKKIRDISSEKDSTINLQKPKKTSQKKNFHLFKNKKQQVCTDIKTEKDHAHSYVKGKRFHNPQFGRLLKMAAVGFFIIALINLLAIYQIGKNIEQDIKNTAEIGLSSLMSAGKNLQNPENLSPFGEAIQIFSEAEKEYWFFTNENFLMNNKEVMGSSVANALATGKHFAQAGADFSDALRLFQQIPNYFVIKNSDQPTYTPSITDTLNQGLDYAESAIEEINLATENLQQINMELLPAEYQETAQFAQEKIEILTKTITEIKEHFPAILKLLGDRYPHRYLVLLQNNSEVRPTGGFIGSYMIVDLNEGYIQSYQAHDVYDIDGAYTGYIEPPAEIKIFTDNWRFRDSNYSPDFPLSAKKAAWFLEKEGGPGVDSVIAVNVSVLKDFLQATGPIYLANFGNLDAENYETVLSFVIESKVWGAEDPKHILKVFVQKFKDTVLNQSNLSELSKALMQALSEKQIMAYSKDAEIQAFFDYLGISGRIYQNKADEDYLSVVHISFGGNKSDRLIEEEILHHTYLQDDGSLIDEVTINRTHTWSEELGDQWEETVQDYNFSDIPEHLRFVLGKGPNKVLTRIYVPKGSVLLDSTSHIVATKYDPELQKHYFLTAIMTEPEKTSSITVKYKLPFKLEIEDNPDTYKFIVQKQPGNRGSIFTKTMEAEKGIQNYSVYPSGAKLEIDGSTTYATSLLYDRYHSSLWGK